MLTFAYGKLYSEVRVSTMFTQRHYIKLASTLRLASLRSVEFAHEANSGRVPSEYARGYNEAVYDIVRMLCDDFEADNSKFDRERFLNAVTRP